MLDKGHSVADAKILTLLAQRFLCCSVPEKEQFGLAVSVKGDCLQQRVEPLEASDVASEDKSCLLYTSDAADE